MGREKKEDGLAGGNLNVQPRGVFFVEGEEEPASIPFEAGTQGKVEGNLLTGYGVVTSQERTPPLAVHMVEGNLTGLFQGVRYIELVAS